MSNVAAGVGVGWMCQLVPFHRSAKVRGPEAPTAVQAVALHATPLKKLSWPAESTGVGWMVHFVPFHRSARVAGAEVEVPFRFPAAVQAFMDVQDTAARTPPGDGLGVSWMAQRVPSHRSASVPMGFPALSVRAPTAVHDDGEVHATPAKKLPGDPVGLGAACWCQRAPSHRSENSPTGTPELLNPVPAAMHDDPEVQATPNRAAPAAPAGLGMA